MVLLLKNYIPIIWFDISTQLANVANLLAKTTNVNITSEN